MRYCCFLLLTLFISNLQAQTAIFSNRTTRLHEDDQAIVVPEVGGMSHMLLYTPNEPIRLQIYSRELQWQEERQLPFKLNYSSSSNITILPFKNEYYLYNEGEALNGACLWKINSAGIATDQSAKLRSIIKSSFKDTVVHCHLSSYGSTLYVMANLFYPSAKKLVTTLVQTDVNLENPVIKRYTFDFDPLKDLNERFVVVPDHDLIVFKTQVTEAKETMLEVLKIKLLGGPIYTTRFNTAIDFVSIGTLFNSVDSGLTIATITRGLPTPPFVIRNVFCVTVNDTLRQMAEPIIARVPIRQGMSGAFTFIKSGEASKWLESYGSWNAGEGWSFSSAMFVRPQETFVINASSYRPKLQAIHPRAQRISDAGDVRFTVVNNRSKKVQDTTLRHRGRSSIEVAQYATFTKDNSNYLVVKERFSSKRKGLLLFYVDKQGKLVQSPLALYERYYYALPQLQQTHSGSIVMPFIYKGEVGLVNISLDKS